MKLIEVCKKLDKADLFEPNSDIKFAEMPSYLLNDIKQCEEFKSVKDFTIAPSPSFLLNEFGALDDNGRLEATFGYKVSDDTTLDLGGSACYLYSLTKLKGSSETLYIIRLLNK